MVTAKITISPEDGIGQVQEKDGEASDLFIASMQRINKELAEKEKEARDNSIYNLDNFFSGLRGSMIQDDQDYIKIRKKRTEIQNKLHIEENKLHIEENKLRSDLRNSYNEFIREQITKNNFEIPEDFKEFGCVNFSFTKSEMKEALKRF